MNIKTAIKKLMKNSEFKKEHNKPFLFHDNGDIVSITNIIIENKSNSITHTWR